MPCLVGMRKMNLYKNKVIKSAQVAVVDQHETKPTQFQALDCMDGNGNLNKEKGADQIKAEFEQTLKNEKETACKQGYAIGFKEGRERHIQESIPDVSAVVSLIHELERTRRVIFEKSERHILSLAFAIAEKIVHQAVVADRDVIRNVLRDAIKNIVDREGMRIRLNPADFHYMMETKGDFLDGFDNLRNVVFEEDGAIKRGGAVIETLFGEVDARLEHQLTEIKKALIGN